jgi:hypothetical protein
MPVLSADAVALTLNNELYPIAVFRGPVYACSVFIPTAVFSLPVEFAVSAFLPTPVLLVPVVVATDEPTPTAVLLEPVVFRASALSPTAVLPVPDVTSRNALWPRPVLEFAAVYVLPITIPAVVAVPAGVVDDYQANPPLPPAPPVLLQDRNWPFVA